MVEKEKEKDKDKEKKDDEGITSSILDFDPLKEHVKSFFMKTIEDVKISLIIFFSYRERKRFS